MAEVLIHRCTLRVVRRAGWSWGPNPKHVADGALRVLPELLAQKLSELLPDDEEREFAAPIRVRLPVRLSELLGDAVPSVSRHTPSGSRVTIPLDQRLDTALRTALGLASAPTTDPSPRSPSRLAAVKRSETPPSATTSATESALKRLLHTWREQGVLARHLASLPDAQITTWHGYFWHGSPTATPSDSDADLADRIERLVLTLATVPESTQAAATLRHRLLAATEVSAQLSLPLTHPSLWRALDHLIPCMPAPSAPTAAAESNTASPTRRPLPLSDAAPTPNTRLNTPAARPPAGTDPHPHEWEVKIPCALPFLLLNPLAGLGYFSALTAVLESIHLADQSHLFATALAYKVLDPPRRGWQRSPDSRLSAATLSAVKEPIPEESLVELARRLAPHTSALDLILADALIAGHSATEPVVLHRTDPQSYLLIDTQGCFPIAWTTLEAVLSLLARLASPVVLVTDEAADLQLLRQLDTAGLTFISALPPTRHEPWERIQQAGWTNFRGPPTGSLLQAAASAQLSLTEARAFTRELIDTRPSVIHTPAPQFDRSITLAASVALGTISWQLWRTRARTTPQQVLERYSDLDGWIQFREASVHVELPLGRRRLELSASGLLAPLEAIPWLAPRRLEFAGGRR